MRGAAVGLRRHRHVGRPADRRHRLRDAAPPHRRRRDGQAGAWGFPRGGMGGGHRRRWPRRPARSAPRSAPRRRSARIRTSAGRVTGVDAGQRRGDRRADGRHDRAPADLVPRAARPGRAARRLRGRHPALADPHRHGEGQLRGRPAADVHRHPDADPQVHGGTIVLAESARRRRARVPGRRRGRAVGSAVRRHLHPERVRRLARAARAARRVDVHPVGAARPGRPRRTRPSWTPTPTG